MNDRRKIVPPFRRPSPGRPVDPESAVQIRDVLWADDALHQQFLGEGAADLDVAERELIASWKHRVRGQFVIYDHLHRGSSPAAWSDHVDRTPSPR